MRNKIKKHNTCFSSGDGEDIAGFTGAQTVPGKHADVVCWGIYLDYCGLCLVGAKVYNSLCVIPWGYVREGGGGGILHNITKCQKD